MHTLKGKMLDMFVPLKLRSRLTSITLTINFFKKGITPNVLLTKLEQIFADQSI
jgi:hypothetical protein